MESLYNKEKKRRITDTDFNNTKMKELPSDEDSEKNISREDFLKKVMKIVNNDPDSRIAKIFSMRYLEGDNNKLTPWKNIGANLELSIQGCINIHDKAISKIKKELKWHPLFKFDDAIKSMIKEIHEWKDAPLWTPKKIKKATKTWFSYLANSK